MLEKSWPEIEPVIKNTEVALIPIGSVEQHGPHAPLGTDFIIANTLSKQTARDKNVITTPAIPVGISSHHRQFWGTLWIKPEIFKSYVKGIAQSLNYHGINKIIFVNGHGGNRSSLREVARDLRMENRIYSIVWTWFDAIEDLIRDIFEGLRVLHADGPETSMMMAIREELIKSNKITDAKEGGSKNWGNFKEGAEVSYDVIDFSTNGVVGDPTKASKEKGVKLFQAAKEKLSSLIEWLEQQELPNLLSKPHKK